MIARKQAVLFVQSKGQMVRGMSGCGDSFKRETIAIEQRAITEHLIWCMVEIMACIQSPGGRIGIWNMCRATHDRCACACLQQTCTR